MPRSFFPTKIAAGRSLCMRIRNGHVRVIDRAHGKVWIRPTARTHRHLDAPSRGSGSRFAGQDSGSIDHLGDRCTDTMQKTHNIEKTMHWTENGSFPSVAAQWFRGLN